jgi:hypothetical protein
MSCVSVLYGFFNVDYPDDDRITTEACRCE